MAFKCGHCGEKHDTVDEARECATSERQARGDDSPATPKFLQAEVDKQTTTMQPKSQQFLRDLLNQFGLILADGMTPETIDWRTGKNILNGLIDARRLRASHQPYALPDGVLSNPGASQHGTRRPTPHPMPDCPAGHYAVPGKLVGYDKNDLYFYRVKRPENGQWAGRTFVDAVIGGHPDQPIRGKDAVKVLKAILTVGSEDAGILYGTNIGQCYRCNRHLTDELSRALGIGPECRSRQS